MKIKERFRGTGQVFSFTLTQLLKSKANLLTLILALLIAVASVPVSSLFADDQTQEGVLRTVYVSNDTAVDLSGLEKALRENDDFKDVEVVMGRLPEGEKQAIEIRLTEGEDLNLSLEWKDSENVSYSQACGIGSIAYDHINKVRIEASGLTDEQKAQLSAESRSNVFCAEDYVNYDPEAPVTPLPGHSTDVELNQDNFDTQLGFSVFLMMLCVFSISYVVRAVVEEKSSKLVDLLMVSVSPDAMMLGKVLAALVFALLYMVVLLGGFLVSSKVTPLFMEVVPTGPIAALLSMNLSAKGLAVCVITGAIGFFAFGVLAALSGAGCSTMEESGGAMSTCMILLMAGYMVSIIAGSGTSETVRTVLCIVPVISMFVLPTQYMCGAVGAGTAVCSWLVQAACALLILRLSSKVYSQLIMYSGKRVGLDRMLKMARGKEAL